MPDRHIEPDFGETFIPVPILTGEVLLVDQHAVADDDNSVRTRLLPRLKPWADFSQNRGIQANLRGGRGRPTVTEV